ncbi:MAG: efflux RND transporter permease subunit [Deltaproteobacteria bacterium]|nr:efflux RND transporter permease subunit [Deltaproteobacteria bacterium]
MWISNASIRNPVVTVAVVVGLLVFGVIALLNLDTDEFPEVNPPVISVAIPYPGASPDVVEREIVAPLEDAFASISGIDEVRSTSMDGFALLTIIFLFDKDLQQASQDIRDKISEERRELPPEMEEPILTRFDPQDLPILSVTLSSTTVDVATLTQLADPGIVGELRAVNGVADVDVIGGLERELTIELRPHALQAAGVDVAQVVAAVQAGNLAAPVGRVSTALEERQIRLRGRLEKPEDFGALVVTANGPSVVRLRDIATVKDGTEEARSMALFGQHGDRQPAVGIDIKKATNASTTSVSDRVHEKLREIERGLPAGVTLTVVRDAGVRVAASVKDVQTTLLEGALLTVLVVFLFLASWRSTVITGLALPVSVIASFVAVFAFGFTLNSMSLMGLSLAIGILVDDAIVVRENIVRHMERGKDHVTAARDGTAEIGLAVAATTSAIVVVFVPVAFMGGIAEQWFAPFALTIAASVLVSLFVSFSLDPMLSASWADPEVQSLEKGGKRSWVSRKLHALNAVLERRTGDYQRLIRWALDHRKTMLSIAALAFVGALALPATGIVGSSFFPVQDRSEFIIKLEAPPGSSLEYTRRKAVDIDRIAQARPEVAYTYTTIGREDGGVVDEASMFVRLVPRDERERTQQAVEADVRAAARRVAGLTTSLDSGFFGGEKQIQVQLTGPELAVLNKLAEELAEHATGIPGAVDVGLPTRGQRPELEVIIDRDLASTLNLSVGAIAQALRPAFAGLDSGDWVDPLGETRDVTVRLEPNARTGPSNLEQLPLVVRPNQQGPGTTTTTTTTTVPLGQVARIARTRGPAQIEHFNGDRIVTVGANVEGVALSEVVQKIEARAKTLQLPPGYRVLQGGETDAQREVFTRILTSLSIAILLMYMILVVQFRSFLDPLAILASLPLSLIGVMLALLISGSTLNLMSMIGVILLMGIVAKNAILLIDFAKRAQREGLDRHAAIIKAGGTRLRPILMTSVAIVAGMLPVAIGGGEGGDFRAPLGRAVIGGVITSTLLTLLVIPTAYDVLASWRESLARRLRGHRPSHPVESTPSTSDQRFP